MGLFDSVVNVDSIKIAEWPCPKINDPGVTSSWDWKVAAAAAVATLATVTAYEIANLQYATAKDSWTLARERWDYFLSTYKPCEITEAAEGCEAAVPTPEYNLANSNYTNAVITAFTNAHTDILRLADTYCVCMDASLNKDIAGAQALMTVDSVNFGMRRAEAMAEALDDLRWNRKLKILSRARGILAEAASFTSTASTMYNQLGEGASAAAGSALSFMQSGIKQQVMQQPTRNLLFTNGFASYNAQQQEPRVWGRTENSSYAYLDNSGVNPYTFEVTAPTAGDYVGVDTAIRGNDIMN